MTVERGTLVWRILLIITLYILQGFVQGLATSIPLYLASYKASWKQQGVFSWVAYPFSFKILWAPVIDSIYSRRIGGRQQTWLVPVQILIGTVLIVLSFHLESLLINLRVVPLTVVGFFLLFLIASQDIVVDGWSVILFNASNPQWVSTCQWMREMPGRCMGTTVLITCESAEFTNRYIPGFLSLPARPYGLFTLQQFVFGWGVAFIVVGFLVSVVTYWHMRSKRTIKDNPLDSEEAKLTLLATYLDIFHLLKKRCVYQLVFILLTFHIGFAATYSMTNLTLIGSVPLVIIHILVLLMRTISRHGVTRQTVALFNLPLFAVHIIVPLCMSAIRHPLLWFARGYIPRLFTSIILASYVFFTPRLLHMSYYYPLLIGFLCLNEILVYVNVVSRCGNYARVSEPRIAGTYMTLLATMTNSDHTASSTIVLYAAEWLPKSHAYSMEVAVCVVLGFLWIGLVWKMLTRLDAILIHQWHLKPSLAINLPSTTTNSQANIVENYVNSI